MQIENSRHRFPLCASESAADLVVVAEIVRPRGNRGELVAQSQTDVPGRIEGLKNATARLADGSLVPVKIEQAWPHKENWVLQFSGVDSIESAEKFRGADLCIAASERGTLPDGDFFESDLVGCTVIDKATGRPLGPLEGFQSYGGAPLMELTIDTRQVLVPFVKSLCQVDLLARTIRVDIPEGLLEL